MLKYCSIQKSDQHPKAVYLYLYTLLHTPETALFKDVVPMIHWGDSKSATEQYPLLIVSMVGRGGKWG